MKYNAILDVEKSEESVTEPVTPAEIKEYLRIDLDDDDTLLGILIKAARKSCEAYTNVSFVEREVTAELMNQLGGQPLPYGPVGDIISFKDCNGDDVDEDNYKIDGVQFKRVKTCFDGPITVSYNAGYEALPEDLKVALMCQVAWLYEHRGDEQLKTGLSEQSKLLLSQYRRAI